MHLYNLTLQGVTAINQAVHGCFFRNFQTTGSVCGSWIRCSAIVLGHLCQLSIADNTFMDAEDGDTRRLSLSVDSIGDEQQRNFLMTVPQSTQLEGVPLEAGTFTFRLNVRDRANQIRIFALNFQFDR
ncbi:CBR-DGN-1 protein [Ditylenchus destructor]|nr:CBR-DGN-1 protein [Ditylenchus destructor]